MRARIVGDIEHVFPDAKVEANKGTNYKYRAKVAREVVAKALHDQAMSVGYPNFKRPLTFCLIGVANQRNRSPRRLSTLAG